MKLNNGYYGEKLYKVTLGTGTAWTRTFEVYAYNEGEAVDLVADYCERRGMNVVYTDHYGIADECETNELVAEYAEANGLTCCGNSGIYMQILNIQEVA